MSDRDYYAPYLERLPPSNVQAEQALLGAIMANNQVYGRVCDYLRPEHFADPIHGRIFTALEERILESRLADAVTLKGDLENIGALDEVGGTAYLAQLLTAMVGITNATEYGRTIHDTWIRRQLIRVGEQIVEGAFVAEPGMTAADQIDAAEKALMGIRADGVRRDRLVSIGEAVAAAIRSSEAAYKEGRSPALLSGLEALDRATGGFWPGDLSLLGGVPGAGKTALAVQIGTSIGERLRQVAAQAGLSPEDVERQPGVAIFELEMSAEELGARVAAARAGISLQRLRAGDLTTAIAEKLMFVERGVAGLPFRIHDCRATGLRMLGAKIRMHLRRQPELLVMVDHLLVADAEEIGGRISERNAQSVARAAREFKKMAGDLGLPFLVLTHVPRSAGRRDNPRPRMDDVKYGGEGDADNVYFVHRPIMFRDIDPLPKAPKETEEKYAARVLAWRVETDRIERLAEFVVAKARMNTTGIYNMRWDGPTTSFGEWQP